MAVALAMRSVSCAVAEPVLPVAVIVYVTAPCVVVGVPLIVHVVAAMLSPAGSVGLAVHAEIVPVVVGTSEVMAIFWKNQVADKL